MCFHGTSDKIEIPSGSEAAAVLADLTEIYDEATIEGTSLHRTEQLMVEAGRKARDLIELLEVA